MTQPNRTTEGSKPACKLVGTDGNVFSIIGRVKQALKKAGEADRYYLNDNIDNIVESGQ